MEARRGFLYQDHIAARFLLEMLSKPCLAEVWCETHDDIVLLWNCSSGLSVEFVQVKSEDPGQLWSVALLCQRVGGKPGTSIVERSLARARCGEPSRFRLVTASGVNDSLGVMRMGRSTGTRSSHQEAINQLETAITAKVGALCSPSGMSGRAWLDSTRWLVAESCEAVQNANLLELDRLLYERGLLLGPEHRGELYKRILQKVHEAAAARWDTSPKAKKIICSDFDAWLGQAARDFAHPSTGTGGSRLARKMRRAELSNETILGAEELRLDYRRRSLEEDFIAPSPYSELVLDVRYSLHKELVALDAGEVEPGGKFLVRCLNVVQGAYSRHKVGLDVQEAFAAGCMYDMTDRCTHRFGAPEP